MCARRDHMVKQKAIESRVRITPLTKMDHGATESTLIQPVGHALNDLISLH